MTNTEKFLNDGLQSLRLMDAPLVHVALGEDIATTQFVLQMLLGYENDFTVNDVRARYMPEQNTDYHGHVCGQGRYNGGKKCWFDIQGRLDEMPIGTQARIGSAKLDTELYKVEGEENALNTDLFEVIFSEQDEMGGGLPVYTVTRRNTQTNEELGDGGHVIIVNTSYNNEDSYIGKLIHDFRCTKAADMYLPILSERMKYLKETEEGRKTVFETMKTLCNHPWNGSQDLYISNLLLYREEPFEIIAQKTGADVSHVFQVATRLISMGYIVLPRQSK